MGFMMQIRPEVLKKLREDYPTGAAWSLSRCLRNRARTWFPTDREVMFVDDAGGIHVAWSNGSTLAAIHGIDVIRRID
jgi:hypothetical protein